MRYVYREGQGALAVGVTDQGTATMAALPDSAFNVYKPFKPNKIRLLRIHKSLNPANIEQVVRCSLKTVVLKGSSQGQSQRKYVAHSYEWGGEVNEFHSLARCFVNGHEIFPTRNLRFALPILRSRLVDSKTLL